MSEKYQAIKRFCLENNFLWDDQDFPAKSQSISPTSTSSSEYVWLRPKEIVPQPVFVANGFVRFDANQGELGNCWFVAAVANLTLHEDLLFKVVPKDQSFQENYCGVFYFNFWQYGEWVEVCVDDRLPTVDGQLVFMHSTERAEFWPALLEKAYAKLSGCYGHLKGGSGAEAMEDLTGGIVEVFNVPDSAPGPNVKFLDIVQAMEGGALMCCSIVKHENGGKQLLFLHGLMVLHEFSIVGVKSLNAFLPGSQFPSEMHLLRVRNPYGNLVEWNGPWSDCSKEWSFVSEADKAKLGLDFKADGEFWMSFEDFKSYFQILLICHVCRPDDACRMAMNAYECRKPCKQWQMVTFHDAWTPGKSAGGCPNNPGSFPNNPQYQFDIKEGCCCETEKASNCILALMQKHRRRETSESLFRYHNIGLVVYEVDDSWYFDRVLGIDFFSGRKPVSSDSSNFVNARETCQRLCLRKGRYVVVPCTYNKNVSCQFLLRLYSKNFGARCIEEPITIPSLDLHDLLQNEDEENIRKAISKISGGRFRVDSKTLHLILQFLLEGKGVGTNTFSLDQCHLLLLMSTDYRFNWLTTGETVEMCRSIMKLAKEFIKLDIDGSGRIDETELVVALDAIDCRLSNRIQNVLLQRYRGVSGCISFLDFVLMVMKLKFMKSLLLAC